MKARWERVDAAAERLTANQQSLVALAKGLESINQANAGLLDLADHDARPEPPFAGGEFAPAEDRLDERRFPAAVGADDRDPFAEPDLEIDGPQRCLLYTSPSPRD